MQLSSGFQIEGAFAAGYDPALELATHMAQTKPTGEDLDYDLDGPWTEHLRRKEQDMIDRIVHGGEHGHYFILLGPKVKKGAFDSRHKIISPHFLIGLR